MTKLSGRGLREDDLIYSLIKNKFKNPVMIDVGAHGGGSCKKFAESNWVIYAFEPCKSWYNTLERECGNMITCERKAVSNIESQNVALYTSRQSGGITSLFNFHSSHQLTETVDTIRLDNYMKLKNIEKVDYLKVDAEGHDFFVLKGYDWNYLPSVIEVEFEDLKTSSSTHNGEKTTNNYTWDDMANFLKDKGYNIVVSEWNPIVRYGGGVHTWNTFKTFPCKLDTNKAWGNMICFLDKELFEQFKLEHF